jgi:hypothetical protein
MAKTSISMSVYVQIKSNLGNFISSISSITLLGFEKYQKTVSAWFLRFETSTDTRAAAARRRVRGDQQGSGDHLQRVGVVYRGGGLPRPVLAVVLVVLGHDPILLSGVHAQGGLG